MGGGFWEATDRWQQASEVAARRLIFLGFPFAFDDYASSVRLKLAGKVAVAFLAPSPPFILMGFRVPATLSPIGLAIRDWGLGPAQLSLAWSDFMTTEGVY